MKSIFLSVVFSCSLFASPDRPASFLGKWHSISKVSAIEEVVFYPDNIVRLSDYRYAFHQRYFLSPDSSKPEGSFKGVFQVINVGKLVKESKVDLRLLEKDVMELSINEKKMILKKD